MTDYIFQIVQHAHFVRYRFPQCNALKVISVSIFNIFNHLTRLQKVACKGILYRKLDKNVKSKIQNVKLKLESKIKNAKYKIRMQN